METKRVVVTGMGIVSPIGNDVSTFWNNLINGYCGIDFLTGFPTDDLPVKIGGQIHDFSPKDYGLSKSFVWRNDPFTLYGMAAAVQAMDDSGLDAKSETPNIDSDRFGVYVGSGTGGLTTLCRESKALDAEGARLVSPFFVAESILNILGANIAIRYRAQGACVCQAAACATSTQSIGEAFRAIQHGELDAVIAGGSECAAIPLGIAGFANMRALSRATDPRQACRPFHAERDGFVISDGAAIIILEEYQHAKDRGARIYAEVVGYGNNCDAYHVTTPAPDAKAPARCMKAALSEARFDEETDSLYINAHGTGTVFNDAMETQACKLALGDQAYKCRISSTKSMHGHMIGAAGAAEAIAAIMALRNGIVPPTINLDNPAPECDLNYTPNTAVCCDISLALSNSFGFGGHNCCLAFRK